MDETVSRSAAPSPSRQRSAAGEEFSSQALSFFGMLLNVFEPERGWWLGILGWLVTATQTLGTAF